MQSLFDTTARKCSKLVTNSYSTSFSIATKMLSSAIRQDIYNIYGFVRFADEIVDTFHQYDKERLFDDFERQLYEAIDSKISMNPILHAYQETVHRYAIPSHLYEAFLKSMRLDIHKKKYRTTEEYQSYIYGSADVVGLMCLQVFVGGDHQKYISLKSYAQRLGSAFQKVNFLRDLKSDHENLNRSYFPNTDLNQLSESAKQKIIEEIESDFEQGLKGILLLPVEAKFGVYTAYVYYRKLLQKLKKTPSVEIKNTRIRIPNHQKIGLLFTSYFNYRLNLL